MSRVSLKSLYATVHRCEWSFEYRKAAKSINQLRPTVRARLLFETATKPRHK